MDLECVICKASFKRYGKQARIAKTCSYKCLGKYNKASSNCNCDQCGKEFHKKFSQQNKSKNNFCSVSCLASWKSINQNGANNPNFRNVMYDSDGSRIVWSDTHGRIKMHHAVVFETLKISKIPTGYHVHHRDCNHRNNTAENLVLLSSSDHRWLHKQYGNATLYAYYYNKIDLESLISWSTDKERALRLLTLNIIEQAKTGVLKSCELLETPEEDNQQPSTIEI
jgi:hypothetical protein